MKMFSYSDEGFLCARFLFGPIIVDKSIKVIIISAFQHLDGDWQH